MSLDIPFLKAITRRKVTAEMKTTKMAAFSRAPRALVASESPDCGIEGGCVRRCVVEVLRLDEVEQ